MEGLRTQDDGEEIDTTGKKENKTTCEKNGGDEGDERDEGASLHVDA